MLLLTVNLYLFIRVTVNGEWNNRRFSSAGHIVSDALVPAFIGGQHVLNGQVAVGRHFYSATITTSTDTGLILKGVANEYLALIII